MNNEYQVLEQGVSNVQETNKVLRNTYALLSMTLAFSAVTAFIAMQFGAVRVPFLLHIVIFFALLFAIEKTKNSAAGLGLTFVFTGYLGYNLAPIMNMYLAIPNGSELITSALAMTAGAFLGLSAFAVNTKKDFSFLGSFLFAGFIVIMVGALAAWLFEIPMLMLAISVGIVLFSCAAILWQTSEIIHGGETNYISATVGLYVSIYNLFLSLLTLLGVMNSDD
jgi:modulator of FtsH protease